jgi:hypothetical protein
VHGQPNRKEQALQRRGLPVAKRVAIRDRQRFVALYIAQYVGVVAVPPRFSAPRKPHSIARGRCHVSAQFVEEGVQVGHQAEPG